MYSFAAGVATFVPLLLLARTTHIYLENKVFNASDANESRALTNINMALINSRKIERTVSEAGSTQSTQSQPQTTQKGSEFPNFCQIKSTSALIPPSVARSTAACNLSSSTDSFKLRKCNLGTQLEGYLNGELKL